MQETPAVREAPEEPAPATVEPTSEPVARDEDAGAAEPAAPPQPDPHGLGGPSITGSGSGGGSCGEEAERECQMRGGNCSLVADSPCVGRGTRCQDWEMEMSSGCRCYCEPTDSQGRPVLPR